MSTHLGKYKPFSMEVKSKMIRLKYRTFKFAFPYVSRLLFSWLNECFMVQLYFYFAGIKDTST